jgi:hypothetical protein
MVMKDNPGTVKWPTGTVTSLKLPESQRDHFYVVRYPPNHPEQAHCVSTAFTKDDLYRHFFHYAVMKLGTSGKRCRGCDQVLDTNGLALQTYIICILFIRRYSMECHLPYTIQYHLLRWQEMVLYGVWKMTLSRITNKQIQFMSKLLFA